jgi:decaprenyl-phosphate phosphoribosyltransferase
MGSQLTQLLKLARPWHWIKNGFVLAPVPFALAVGAELDLPVFVLGLLGFSLVNSAAYAFNDVRDAEADRQSPAKRSRPVASGAVSPARGVALAASLALVGVTLCWLTGVRAAIVLSLIYLSVNLVYSLGAKNLPVLDVFLLASGFLIRVILGCALVAVAPSNWLLLCSSALALFLAFGKRRADVVAGLTSEHRASLSGYTLGFLDSALAITAGIALFAYALYSQESPAFVEGRQLVGLPFVAFGILDYLRVAMQEGVGGSPVEMAYRSRSLQISVLGWAIATAWSLGLSLPIG